MGMPVAPLLTEGELDALRQFDTCMVANAIEFFNVRLRNTGFADASVRCMFEDAPPMLGYAVTGRLRSGEPPIGGSTFHDRAGFWNSILEVPHLASWCWKTWTIRPEEVLLSGICTPRF
jgi:4-hydroxy-4-methyl-2-oxoglutarate aldolase